MNELTHPDDLDFMDAESLMCTPMPDIRYHIRGLLPQGTHLLCGAPKVGKSWLSLWLAVQLSRGAPVWDLPTERCGVLYLCLEDTLARVKDRLYRITDEVPDTLHLCTYCREVRFGLEQQLERYLIQYPQTKVIIIDTLQKVRGESSDSGSVYRTDYRDIAALKSFGTQMGVSFLLVHHLRKMQDDSDPFNMISGSNGLSGAVDSMFLLYKDKRTENTARFIATGRDTEMQELRLKFENCVWQMLERTTGDILPQEAPVPPEVIAAGQLALEKRAWWGTATELCAALSPYGVQASPSRITQMISRFAERYLKPNNVGYTTSRTKTARTVGLFRIDTAENAVDRVTGDR